MRNGRHHKAEASGYEHAARQNGVVTTGQLLAVGWSSSMIERRVRSGLLRRVVRGVFMVQAAPVTPYSDLQAAVLSAGQSACAGGLSALWLHGLLQRPKVHDVIVLGTNKPARPRGQLVRTTRTMHGGDAIDIQGIRAQSVERALLDVALDLDRQVLAECVAEAIRSGKTSVPRLRARCEDYAARWPHCAEALRDVVEDIDDQATRRESMLEDHLRPVLEEVPGEYEVQHPVAVDGERYRIDAAFVDAGVEIEVDGYLAHCTPWHLRHDARRQNALTFAGWKILRYTWDDVRDDPKRVADEIRDTLPLTAAPEVNRPAA